MLKMLPTTLISVALLLLATTTKAILPGKSNICQERNLHLNCECTYLNKVLNVTSFLHLNVHNGVNRITIQKCDQVRLAPNAIAQLYSLRFLEIIYVKDLILEERALTWAGYDQQGFYEPPSLNINIKDTKVSRVAKSAFSGAPVEIRLERSQFYLIDSFAFSSLSHLSLISIQDCEFKQMHLQAFKGIQTKKFLINNSTFKEALPSRAFIDIIIDETFSILSSKFNVVKPNSFIIKTTIFELINSSFEYLETECFSIRTKSVVIIKNNYFRNLQDNAFMGINLIKETKYSANQDLLFEGNTLNDIKKASISFNKASFTPRYGAIFLNKTCSCIEIQQWLVNNEIKEHLQCVNDTRRQTSIQVEVFKQRVCEAGSKTWIILVVVFCVLLVLLIIAAVVIGIVYRKYKKRKHKEYVNRGRTKTGSVGLIVPDGRTYRETEVHVIVEKAELLTTEL